MRALPCTVHHDVLRTCWLSQGPRVGPDSVTDAGSQKRTRSLPWPRQLGDQWPRFLVNEDYTYTQLMLPFACVLCLRLLDCTLLSSVGHSKVGCSAGRSPVYSESPRLNQEQGKGDRGTYHQPSYICSVSIDVQTTCSSAAGGRALPSI